MSYVRSHLGANGTVKFLKKKKRTIVDGLLKLQDSTSLC